MEKPIFKMAFLAVLLVIASDLQFPKVFGRDGEAIQANGDKRNCNCPGFDVKDCTDSTCGLKCSSNYDCRLGACQACVNGTCVCAPRPPLR